MDKEYDVVIIGAGGTGLLTAAYLSGKYKVLVVEKNNFLGGFAGTCYKDGFYYNIGAHFIPATFKRENYIEVFLDSFPEYKEDILKLLKPTGLGFVEESQVKNIGSGDTFFNDLKGDFPDEAPAIEEFRTLYHDTLEKLYNPHSFFGKNEGGDAASGEGWNALEYITSKNKENPESSYEVIDRMFQSDGLKKRVIGMSIWPGGSFDFFCVYLDNFLHKGVYTVTGGFEKLWQQISDIIKKNGGEVILGNGVTHIDSIDGRVSAVTLEDNRKVFTSHLISTISVNKLYSNLIDKTAKSELMKSKLDMPLSVSAIQLTMGVDGILDERFPPGYYVVSPKEFSSLKEWFKDTENKIFNPNFPVWIFIGSGNMEISEAGKTLVQAIVPIYGEVYEKLSGEERKNMVDHLRSIILSNLPIKEEHILFEDLMDPAGYAEVFGSDGGSVFGWHVGVKNSMKPKSKSKVLKGLYHAGQWVFLGGLPGAFWGAKLAAELLERYAPVESIQKKG